MDRMKLEKFLAGLSMATLLAGAGCASSPKPEAQNAPAGEAGAQAPEGQPAKGEQPGGSQQKPETPPDAAKGQSSCCGGSCGKGSCGKGETGKGETGAG